MSPGRPAILLVVAALIHGEGGRVLLSRRPPGGSLSLCWEFPGGKVKFHESPEQALVRELQEELGIQALELVPWTFVSHAYDTFHLLMPVYHCHRFVGEPRALDVHEVGWFRREELGGLDFPPADRPLVAMLTGC